MATKTGAPRSGRSFRMIRTITVGSYISVQGMFERDLGNGQIAVKVGEQTYVGKAVTR